MDLWIRSQDRDTLLKIERLDVDNDVIMANFKKHYSECDYIIIGRYINNKRALEVLDEIQEHLDYLNIGKINRVDEKGFRVCTIYEMPKE